MSGPQVKKENEARIPGTVTLEERAAFALNHLRRNLDPKLGWLPYFWTFLEREPAEAGHDFPDYGDMTGRYVDALVLAHQMTGSEEGINEELNTKKLLMSFFDESDGLSYRRRTPWSKHDALIFDQSSVLIALVSWCQQTGEEQVLRSIDKLVKGLWDISVKEKDFCYYPFNIYTPRGWNKSYRTGNPGVTFKAADAAYDGGRALLPLAQYFELTGSADCERVIRGLANWVIYHSPVFSKDGGFLSHFHSRTASVAGILKYGLIKGDRKLIDWARMVYDWIAQSLYSSSFGWFVEGIDSSNVIGQGCETCCITDMVDLAIILGEAGYTQYWNDAERYIRNHLVESQLLDTGWIVQPVEWVMKKAKKKDTLRSSFTDVIERVRGGFAGWSAPNDWVGPNPYGFEGCRMMNCCSAAGVHGLYVAWHHIVTKRKDGVYINFSLNRDSKWVRIESLLPHVGRVSLKVRDAPVIFLRIPDWVGRDRLTATLRGKSLPPIWAGDYIKFSGLKKGDELVVEYPVREKETLETVGGRNLVCKWRGDAVVDISPQGTRYPLYQRAWMRREEPPSMTIPLQAPEKEIHW